MGQQLWITWFTATLKRFIHSYHLGTLIRMLVLLNKFLLGKISEKCLLKNNIQVKIVMNKTFCNRRVITTKKCYQGNTCMVTPASDTFSMDCLIIKTNKKLNSFGIKDVYWKLEYF